MSGLFIRRPVATVLLSLGVLLIGLVCLTRFGISAMPSADAPVIRVSASLPGADAETVATTLTSPLERRLGQIPGVKNIWSNSRAGSASIVMEFNFGRNVNAAARDVQAALNAAGGDIPADLKRMPDYRKMNPSAAPIMVLALTSESLPSSAVYDLAETVVVPRLSQVEGVGDVSVSGAERMAIRIQADPAQLAALELSFAELRTAIAGTNSTQPRGEAHGSRQAYEFAVNNQLLTVNDYKNVVIANRHHTPVRLGDITTIIEATANQRMAARFNGRPAVLISISRLPDANIVDTSERVTAALDQLRGWLPPSVHLDVQSERTASIKAAVDHVGLMVGLTVALAVVVVAVFLRRLWPTVIPAVAIPVALAGTLAIAYVAGFTLNLMSLMALAVAIGFIVDDAIVVVDAIAHRRELGEPPVEAALNGAGQVGFTIVSMSVSLASAFIPLLFMEDFIGRMLLEFSVTVVAAIAVSGVVALTLTPTLCGRLMHGTTGDNAPWTAVVGLYARALRFALRHRFLSLLATIGCVWLMVVLNGMVPQGFFPRQDTGLITAWVEGPQDISFAAMNDRVKAVEAVLMGDPAIQSISSSVSAGRNGSVTIVLKPVEERDVTPDQVVDRLRPKLAAVPGVNAYLIAEQDSRGGPRPDRAEFQYTLVSDDLKALNEQVSFVVKRFREIPAITDVGSDVEVKALQARLEVDRETATRLGVSLSDVDNALNDAFGQREVSTILTNRDQYPVILEAVPQFGQEPERLRDVYLRRSNGDQIPVAALSRLEYGVAPLSVNHHGGFVSASVSFNLATGFALGDATKAVQEAERSLMLPPNVRGALKGDAETFARHQSNQPKLILIAVIAIYIVLGVLYESVIHPITIISTLPPATVGALAALAATQTQLSIVAMIGIILVIGIVMKNAIILVDYAQEARRGGLTPVEAVYEAGLLRFRPIVMTTLTALAGALVIALDHGTGSELRRPLGIAMAGGLAFAQLVTMFSAPVIYVWLAGGWWKRPRWWKISFLRPFSPPGTPPA